MNNNKFYTRTKEIAGKSYTAQFNGMSSALEAIDGCYIDGSSNISVYKLSKYVLSNVIVEPKGLTPDDFDDVDTLNEVVAWGRDVMQGKFRNAEDDSATERASAK